MPDKEGAKPTVSGARTRACQVRCKTSDSGAPVSAVKRENGGAFFHFCLPSYRRCKEFMVVPIF
jgi:hypothetical protein